MPGDAVDGKKRKQLHHRCRTTDIRFFFFFFNTSANCIHVGGRRQLYGRAVAARLRVVYASAATEAHHFYTSMKLILCSTIAAYCYSSM